MGDGDENDITFERKKERERASSRFSPSSVM